MTRVLRVQPSEAQAKLPESRRKARYLWLPPRVRTTWTRLAPMRVLASCRPASKARFFPGEKVRTYGHVGGMKASPIMHTGFRHANVFFLERHANCYDGDVR
jgi:hypothetical protein